jgi:hypothetical protein
VSDPGTEVELRRRAREPFYGGAIGLIGMLLLIGGPVWMLLTVVLHASQISGYMLQPHMVEWGASDSRWDLAFHLPLLLLASFNALILTALLLAVLAVGAWSVRSVAVALDVRLAERASKHYEALVEGDDVLRPDSWEHNLPVREPDEPDTEEPDPADEKE